MILRKKNLQLLGEGKGGEEKKEMQTADTAWDPMFELIVSLFLSKILL